MLKLRATFGTVSGVASRMMQALLRLAKRWAAPGAGPKLVSG